MTDIAEEEETYDPSNIVTLRRLRFTDKTMDSSETSSIPQSPVLHPILKQPKSRSNSLDQLVDAGKEIGLIARLTGQLIGALGFGWGWIVDLFRLLVFVILLLPAFLRIAYWYLTTKQVIRGVSYGKNPRNHLDIYLVEEKEQQLHPVVIFVSGGAWIIGNKAWGGLMCRRLAKHGILTIAVDYRNFPQGTISDMLRDVKVAVQWCIDNVYRFGGDPDRIWIVGQSAGAHIGSLLLMDAVAKAADNADGITASPRRDSVLSNWTIDGDDDMPPPTRTAHFTSTSLAGFIGVSGPYNLSSLPPRLSHRMKLRIFEGDLKRWSSVDAALRLGKWTGRDQRSESASRDHTPDSNNPSLPSTPSRHLDSPVEARGRSPLRGLRFATSSAIPKISPTDYVKNLDLRPLNPFAIPIHLLHGSDDKSVSVVQVAEYSTVLQHSGFKNVESHILPGQTHTDPIIENCIVGGEDELVEQIAGWVKYDGGSGKMEKVLGHKLIPNFLRTAARYVNPF